MLTFCVFLATIVAGVAVGNHHSAYEGWLTIAGGLVCTGLAYPIEKVITAFAERIEG